MMQLRMQTARTRARRRIQEGKDEIVRKEQRGWWLNLAVLTAEIERFIRRPAEYLYTYIILLNVKKKNRCIIML